MVTRRAAVLGSPIGHSLSPVLHAAAYRALGLDDWEYTAVEVDADGLREHVARLDRSWRGLSLTMPLKEVAFDVAADVSAVAGSSGVVNTLLRRGGEWVGDNTDVAGIARSLRDATSAPLRLDRLPTVVIVGSGATARSAVCAVAEAGARHVDLMVRGEPRARTVQQVLQSGMSVGRLDLGAWPEHVDLVVSTVPGVASADIAATLPPGDGIVFDVVYADGASRLASVARQRGYAVVPSTDMLLHQAAEQVRLMTGRPPPVEAMRTALTDALALRHP